MQTELGGALADLLNENGKGSGVMRWEIPSSLPELLQGYVVAVILEILMRRCGPAPVKLVTPEKHRNFVKGVWENPHSKASSKESSATDMDPEVLESSPRMMQRKRKCEEPSIPSEEDGTVESRFRERGLKLVKKAGIRTADRRTEGRPCGNARNKRNFNGHPTASRNTQI
ncbi:hypothetical protein RHSIM_Rhsim09G0183000 [Rhododendron simsii]|uniref:Uncharacterized protein n=1 Tax=Rhododendron simsii TaxID=118357 RepID=A0A834GG36_RHOSS|nr:hypothetical protein RHSIM_Rhsim09G0183000 [Rhododendron simsii]